MVDAISTIQEDSSVQPDATGVGSNNPILLNDFCRQWFDTRQGVLDAVNRVGVSGWYVLGKEVRSFEIELAKTIRRQEVVGCASGLDALELALRALGLKAGQPVLTTPLSAFATTLAIIRAGGVPVFVDVDAYGLIDAQQCRDVLSEDRSLRFFMPVHLYGHALEFTDLRELKHEFDLTIVEDCAQAIGACSEGIPIGTVGSISAMSFYPTKNLGAMGDAGAVASDEPNLANICRALRDYGQTDRYQHDLLGMNSRLDELHAAILRAAYLPRLEDWTGRRQAVARDYLAGISNPAVRLPGAPSKSQSVWHLFPVLVKATDRESFRQHLKQEGILTAIHYPTPIPDQGALRGVDFQVKRPLERTREYCQCEVSLPIHPYLTHTEVTRVVDAVNSWTA